MYLAQELHFHFGVGYDFLVVNFPKLPSNWPANHLNWMYSRYFRVIHYQEKIKIIWKHQTNIALYTWNTKVYFGQKFLHVWIDYDFSVIHISELPSQWLENHLNWKPWKYFRNMHYREKIKSATSIYQTFLCKTRTTCIWLRSSISTLELVMISW